MGWTTHYKYQNLQAHPDGRVRLTDSLRELPYQDIKGTRYIKFRHQGRVKTKTVASIVFETFRKRPVGEGLFVCHKNGDCADNSFNNLVPGDRTYSRKSYARRDAQILIDYNEEFEVFFDRLVD